MAATPEPQGITQRLLKSRRRSVAFDEHRSRIHIPINGVPRRSNKERAGAEGRDRIAELRIMGARIDFFRLCRTDYILPTSLGRGIDEDSAVGVKVTAEQRIADQKEFIGQRERPAKALRRV